MNWIKFTGENNLQSGDIFSCPSKIPKNSPILPGTIVPFIAHVGIIIFIDNKPHVIHNPFDSGPEIVPYDVVFDGERKITKIIRTNLSTEEIVEKYWVCNDKYCHVKYPYSLPYKFFFRNCEDFVRSITGFDIGFDQRIGYFIVIIIIIILLFLLIRRIK